MKSVISSLILLMSVSASAVEFRCEVTHSDIWNGNGAGKKESYTTNFTVTKSKTVTLFDRGEGGQRILCSVSLLDNGKISITEERGYANKPGLVRGKVSIDSISQIISFDATVDSPNSVDVSVRCGLKDLFEIKKD